ncbi:hypothetical protein BJP05_07425 [Corynebacterium sp. NML98-0116]|nr:hypothetical protein BJP05_07425 [Corynebacterium sp. NML98-0116]
MRGEQNSACLVFLLRDSLTLYNDLVTLRALFGVGVADAGRLVGPFGLFMSKIGASVICGTFFRVGARTGDTTMMDSHC